jgi:hypothetical protein
MGTSMAAAGQSYRGVNKETSTVTGARLDRTRSHYKRFLGPGTVTYVMFAADPAGVEVQDGIAASSTVKIVPKANNPSLITTSCARLVIVHDLPRPSVDDNRPLWQTNSDRFLRSFS